MKASDIQERQRFFARSILQWDKINSRDFPWKKSKNAYHILLSEFILQQTRVDQGIPYYNHFIAKYPTIFDLASCSEDEILKSWQGLGYYSRARNLRQTAITIVQKHQGTIPDNYDDLISLPGIGPYTAAAIVSFAYQIPKGAVDGNVIRVFSRYFGISDNAYTASGKKTFQNLADNLIDKKQPGVYNQALMDLGATVCSPRNPQCAICPLSEQCYANLNQKLEEYPVSKRKVKKTNRYFHYIIVQDDSNTLIRKRTNADIWKGLYDFPLVEQKGLSPEKLRLWVYQEIPGFQGNINYSSQVYLHKLSHQNLQISFHHIKSRQKIDLIPNTQLVETKNLRKFAFPKIIDCYLSDNFIYLNKYIFHD